MKKLRNVSIFAVTLLALSFSVCAQVVTADVVGTVTDASGAGIPGATITITNTGTAAVRTATSGATGDYVFTSLQVGTYDLKVQSHGFGDFNAKSLRLSAGDRLRVNARLQVGTQEQAIEVTATAPALQTDSSAVGNLITDRAVQDLPLNGRNFINLVQLSAGVAEGLSNAMNSGTRPDDRRQSSSYSANGQTDEVNNNLLDGMDNNERFIGTIGVRPSIDAVQEVHVETSLYPASIGRSAGAVVELVTKSGTNKFHGSLFEFFRNDKLDSTDYFAKSKPELRQNQFGGSLGGPIIHNKTFFFGDYEGFRQVRGAPSTTTVPTLYEEQHPGDFSDVGGPVVPATQLDPVGLAYFMMYPHPTNSALANNFTNNSTRTQDAKTFDVRVDHHISSDLTVFGRYSFNDVSTFTPPILPQTTITPPAGGGAVTLYPGDSFGSGANQFAGQALERQQNAMLAVEDILSPSVLFELKFGYLRSAINSNPLNFGQNAATAIGFPCNSVSCINVPGNSVTTGLPIIAMDGSSYGSFGDAGFIPLSTIDNSYMLMSSLSWTRGPHSLKFGMGLNRRLLAAGQSSYPRARFDIHQGNAGAAALVALVTGQMQSTQRGNTLNFPTYRTWEPSLYAQDDWRVNRWLTLNLGLRWDVFTPFTERHGQFSNFDPSLGLLISPSLPGVQHSGDTAGVNTDYHDFAPRIGFAATLGHGAVLRGGFGMTFWPGNSASGALMKNAPFTFLYGCGVQPYSGTPCSGTFAGPGGIPQLSAGAPTPTINLATATNPANYLGTGMTTTDFNYRSSYLEQFSLQLQKDFAGNVVSVGYLGNLGRHVTGQININQKSTSTSPYPFPSLPGATIGQRQSQGVTEYNALQLGFQRRLSRGLAANVNYTYANATGNTPVIDESIGNSTYNCYGMCLMDNPGGSPIVVNGWQQYDMGNTDIDIRHRFTAMVNYALPFGNNLQGIPRRLASGWSLNLIGSWQTGIPFTVVNSGVRSGIPGLGADRPDQVAAASLSNPAVTEWFNTAAFVPQASGTLGNEGRNQLFGPHQKRLDFSVFKDFPVREAVHMQFRLEMFNLTNVANFALPGNVLGSGNFGIVTATTPSSTPREIQLGLKLLF